ncbi:unnamed protein product [Arctogadus glacialis]
MRPKCPLKRGGFRSERDNSRRQQRGGLHCRVGYEKANKQMRSSHKPPDTRKMGTRRHIVQGGQPTEV